jgi:chemotaxis regulatin CheY-phosphate phosphatase CheZ
LKEKKEIIKKIEEIKEELEKKLENNNMDKAIEKLAEAIYWIQK